KANSDWANMKDGAGGAFITMGPCVSPRMRSSQPSALGFPPQSLLPSSSRLEYPRTSGRGEPLLRAERHVASSITTLRLGHARRLVQTLAYCPWCGTDHA